MAPLLEKRSVVCRFCGRRFSVLPGDGADVCKDRARCDERARSRGARGSGDDLVVSAESTGPCGDVPSPGSALAEPDCIPQVLPPDRADAEGMPEIIAREQRTLAARAVKVTHKVLDRIEDVLNNGTEVILKDGSSLKQDVQPMALAAILRELRPVVQEPVRAAENLDDANRPILQLDARDPVVVVEVIKALRGLREKKTLAAKQVEDDLPPDEYKQ